MSRYRSTRPHLRAFCKGAEGKALSRFEGVFPVVVSAIPQIVSVHVVGSSEEDVWRVVRSALPDRSKTCLGREEFVRDVWPALWGAFGERWRSWSSTSLCYSITCGLGARGVVLGVVA